MKDLTLKCSDCGNEFVFTEGEQDFYRAKNLAPPQFCPICRGRHKAEKQDLQKWSQLSK